MLKNFETIEKGANISQKCHRDPDVTSGVAISLYLEEVASPAGGGVAMTV